MERRNVIIGLGAGIALALALSFFIISGQSPVEMPQDKLLEVRAAEIGIEKFGVRDIAGLSPKYEKIEVDYYYSYENCLEAAKSVTSQFSLKLNPIKSSLNR